MSKSLLISVFLVFSVIVFAHGSKEARVVLQPSGVLKLTNKKKPKQEKVKKMNPIVIKIDEEKTVMGSLKIKFVSFSHEHASSAPGEPFSASVGVYRFRMTEGAEVLEQTIYTNVTGESNIERIFDRYEIKLLKAASDQKTVTMTVVKSN